LMWISTDPWQLGEMVAYNLDSVFNKKTFSKNSNIESLTIPKDSSMINGVYENVMKFKELVLVINDAAKNKKSLPDSRLELLLKYNPDYFYTYQLLGDYYESASLYNKAIEMYEESLKREISSNEVKDEILEKLNKLKKL